MEIPFVSAPFWAREGGVRRKSSVVRTGGGDGVCRKLGLGDASARLERCFAHLEAIRTPPGQCFLILSCGLPTPSP